MQQMEEAINALGHRRSYQKPAPQTKEGVTFGVVTTFAIRFAIVGGIAYPLWMLIFDKPFANGLLLGLIGLMLGIPLFAFLGALAGGVVGGLIGIPFGIRKTKKVRAALDEQYKEKLKKYRTICSEEDIRIKTELRQKEELIKQKNLLIQRRQESENKLRSFYNYMGIDEDFRNFVPIGYMNEFLRLGVSNKLEGTDGLYYLTLQELRHDQMNYKLETICTKLDEIIDKEHQIYAELLRLNDTCNAIVRQTVEITKRQARSNEIGERIAANTELTAYYAQRIACEDTFQSFMLLYTR